MPKDATWIIEHSALCTADEPTPCSNACPLSLDVRALLGKLAADDMSGARALLEKQVPFADIVSRTCSETCRAGCLRDGLGGTLNIRALERACLDFGDPRSAVRFARRRKEGAVAIIGGGLAGMACALALGRKGYSVDLYERRDVLGGSLRDLPAETMPPEVLDRACAVVEGEVAVHVGFEVSDLSGIAWDACLLATGSGGAVLGADTASGLPVADPISAETSRPALFAAGGVLGISGSAAVVASAQKAARSIERSLAGTSLTAGREGEAPCASRLTVELKGAHDEPEVPVPAGGYTREETVREAGRCLPCECGLCVRTCDLMSRDNRWPKRCIADLSETLSAFSQHTAKVAVRTANSCFACGLCEERCPTGLSMGSLFIETRRILRARGVLPPAFHDFWLRDMAFANGPEAAVPVAAGAAVDYLFFPGCQLGASDPRLVTGAYRALADALGGRRVAIDVGCCGAPAYWAGDEALMAAVQDGFVARWEQADRPQIVLACPTCRKMLSERHPELPLTTIWEVLREQGLPAAATRGEGEEIDLFDPCAGRYDDAAREAVRGLLDRMGFSVTCLSGDGGEARCCGFGGLVYGADPAFAREVAQRRIAQSRNDLVTYCSNCRDVFSSQGKGAYHLLDLLLGFYGEGPAAPPSLGQRRANRRELAAQLTGIIPAASAPGPRIELADGLLAAMDRDLILLEEVQQTIATCEQTGERLLDPGTGHIVSHLQLGIITLWVEYEPADGGFFVHNVYSHRMKVM